MSKIKNREIIERKVTWSLGLETIVDLTWCEIGTVILEITQWDHTGSMTVKRAKKLAHRYWDEVLKGCLTAEQERGYRTRFGHGLKAYHKMIARDDRECNA